MNLSESDAAYAANQFINYFSNMGRIDEYLRNVKLDRMKEYNPLRGIDLEDDMFQKFDMHPNEMNFKVYSVGDTNNMIPTRVFNERLEITTHSYSDYENRWFNKSA